MHLTDVILFWHKNYYILIYNYCHFCGELLMYVSVNTVVCNYLLCILELPLRKHVFCYLARGSKTYATNKYQSIKKMLWD